MKLTRRRVLPLAATPLLLPFNSAFSAAPAGEVEMKTLPFSNVGGKEILLDLYLPPGRTGPVPVVVFLHGGGWSGGTRTTGPDFKRFFAQDGFAMVGLDYRLTPGITFPSNLEDVKTAVRWLRANGAAHGLNTNRIGLWGTSAGGYLVAMAGVTPRGMFEGEGNLNQSSAVQCVLDAYGPTLFDVMDKQTEAEKATLQPVAAPLVNAPNVSSRAAAPPPPPAPAGATRVEGGAAVARLHDAPDSAESMLIGAPIQSAPDKVKAASPLTYVKSGAPPFLIMHGSADNTVPHGQSVIFYEAMAKAGNDATLRLIDGLPHTFFNRTNLDELAGPFRMDVRTSSKGKETKSEDRAGVFDVARTFFTKHLKA